MLGVKQALILHVLRVNPTKNDDGDGGVTNWLPGFDPSRTGKVNGETSKQTKPPLTGDDNKPSTGPLL